MGGLRGKEGRRQGELGSKGRRVRRSELRGEGEKEGW